MNLAELPGNLAAVGQRSLRLATRERQCSPCPGGRIRSSYGAMAAPTAARTGIPDVLTEECARTSRRHGKGVFWTGYETHRPGKTHSMQEEKCNDHFDSADCWS